MGSQLAAMTVDSGTSVETLKFYYDAEGVPFCFTCSSGTFFYITNFQGDIIGISDDTWGMGGFYEYDAWGNIISIEDISSIYSHALAVNPLRYRGYIYDAETGFYYLQSRYYDPSVGRFINADGLLENNLFEYCYNDPVNYYDDGGYSPKRISIRIDDVGFSTEHIHITYNGKVYGWYLYPESNVSNKRHNNELGYNDVSKTLKKTFKKLGVPDKYLNIGNDQHAKQMVLTPNGNQNIIDPIPPVIQKDCGVLINPVTPYKYTNSLQINISDYQSENILFGPPIITPELNIETFPQESGAIILGILAIVAILLVPETGGASLSMII